MLKSLWATLWVGRASPRAQAVAGSRPRDTPGGPGFVLPPSTARAPRRLLSASGSMDEAAAGN